MLVAAFSNAMNMHCVHTLKNIVPPFVNVHYSHLGFLFINGLMSNVYPRQVDLVEIDLSLVLLILGIVISTLFTMYGIFLANTIKSPSLMMPLGYVSVLIGFWADVSLFGTHFTFLPVVGMLLTSAGLLSGFLVTRINDRIAEEESAKSVKSAKSATKEQEEEQAQM
jgi:hypothetical protein